MEHILSKCRQFLLITLFYGLSLQPGISQNVSQMDLSINPSGSPANPSAMLDVQSTNRGVLIPRMSLTEMNLIASPSRGLLVYVLDDGCFYFNQGSPGVPNWKNLCLGEDEDASNEIQTISKTDHEITLSMGGGTIVESHVESAFKWGNGPPVPDTLNFLVQPAIVNVEVGDQVFISSQRALGAFSNAASNLRLWICYREVGNTASPTSVYAGIWGFSLPPFTRIPFGLSAVWTPSAAGSYECGLCGHDGGNGNWVNNEWGYSTAIIFKP